MMVRTTVIPTINQLTILSFLLVSFISKGNVWLCKNRTTPSKRSQNSYQKGGLGISKAGYTSQKSGKKIPSKI